MPDAFLRHMTRADVNESSRDDAFALILEASGAPPEPVPERRPGGIPRAPRFAVRVPVRYKLPGTDEWYRGETGNISHSGIAFETDRSETDFFMAPVSDEGIPVELVLDTRGAGPVPRPIVLGRGILVRVSQALGFRTRTHVAIRLQGQFAVSHTPPFMMN